MTAAPNFAYNLFAKRLRRQADARRVRPVVAAVGVVRRRAGRPARRRGSVRRRAAVRAAARGDHPRLRHGRDDGGGVVLRCGGGMVVDEVDADLLAVLHRADPGDQGHTRRLVSLGKPLNGLEVRIVDEDGSVAAGRAASASSRCAVNRSPGATPRRPASSRRRMSAAGTTPATWAISPRPASRRVRPPQGRHHHGRPNIYPTDIERAACRVDGVRPGCSVAVRLDAGHSRETFAVAVESKEYEDHGRGAPHRTAGGPRGVRRGRRPAPQCRRAPAGHDPQDPVGQAAAGTRPGAGELTVEISISAPTEE